MDHLPRDRDGHLMEPGKCRFATKPGREYVPRRGAHPRDPARPASDDPTAGLPSRARTGVDGEYRELGAEGEENAIRDSEARGSTDAAGGQQADGDAAEAVPGGQLAEGGASSSSSSGRGPDQSQRTRRTWSDTGTGPDSNYDWSRFNVGIVIRALKVCTPAQARLSLRKLHLRWWHAQTSTMTRLVRHAGVPAVVLELIPAIISTCASCRAWARPLPASIASVELADTFNQQVECDLMCVYKFIISTLSIAALDGMQHAWWTASRHPH